MVLTTRKNRYFLVKSTELDILLSSKTPNNNILLLELVKI